MPDLNIFTTMDKCFSFREVNVISNMLVWYNAASGCQIEQIVSLCVHILGTAYGILCFPFIAILPDELLFVSLHIKNP